MTHAKGRHPEVKTLFKLPASVRASEVTKFLLKNSSPTLSDYSNWNFITKKQENKVVDPVSEPHQTLLLTKSR